MDNFLFVPRALAAALFNIAFACTAGVLLANLLLPAASRIARPSTRRFLVAMIASLAVQAWLAAAVMSGSSAPAQVRTALRDVLTGTHAGEVILFSLACAALALLCSVLIRYQPLQTRAVLFFFAILTAARAASGHAASDGNFSLREIVQFLHLAAIAIWSGGVIVSGLLVVPALHREVEIARLQAFTARLSRAAILALLVVAATGAYNSYRSLGLSLVPLGQGAWGTLLIVKVVMAVIAVGMGAYSRNIIQRRPGTFSRDAARLIMALRLESAVMLLILAISGLLANSTPPLQS
jgi:putative copper resistance protein D